MWFENLKWIEYWLSIKYLGLGSWKLDIILNILWLLSTEKFVTVGLKAIEFPNINQNYLMTIIWIEVYSKYFLWIGLYEVLQCFSYFVVSMSQGFRYLNMLINVSLDISALNKEF